MDRYRAPAVVAEYLRARLAGRDPVDGHPLVAEMRMIKSPAEIETIRQAGRAALATGEAGKAAIGEDVPEYEMALRGRSNRAGRST